MSVIMLLGSAFVVFVIALLLGLAIWHMVKQKKNGKCATCPYYTECNKQDCIK
jgi:hypothetical protein